MESCGSENRLRGVLMWHDTLCLLGSDVLQQFSQLDCESLLKNFQCYVHVLLFLSYSRDHLVLGSLRSWCWGRLLFLFLIFSSLVLFFFLYRIYFFPPLLAIVTRTKYQL